MDEAFRKYLVIVDDSPEAATAARFAARRAFHSDNARVVLLCAIEPSEFQHWLGVADRMKDEARERVEARLLELAEVALEEHPKPCEFLVLDEALGPALTRLVDEDPTVKVLVLAAAPGPKGPGPLVSLVARQGAWGERRRTPILVVPGDLTREQIHDLA